MAVITTALATGVTLTGGIVAAGIGTGLAVAGSIGQAYAANKAAGQQQKMANIQNARERKQQLRAMRMQQRALEASGVSSGTYGSSSQVGAIGATASSTAGAIGYQGAMLANAQQITHWNNMATGFGALAQVGGAISANKEAIGNFLSGPSAPPSIPKPTAATINTGSNFATYT